MKNIKMLIVGFIAGALFATATGVSAAAGDKVEAIFADFNIVINGKPATLDQSEIVVNGSSYLPVRSISNALGYDVTYKSDSRTIELNKSDAAAGSSNPSPTSTPSPSPTQTGADSSSSSGTVGVNGDGGDMGMTTSDGLQIVSQNGVDYVTAYDASQKYYDKGYAIRYDANKNEIYLAFNPDKNHPTDKYQTLSAALPFVIINGSTCITVDTYENVILPLIK